MSGTSPVATFTLTQNATQNASQYKGNIDGDFAVAQRIVDQFAPHAAATPNMTILLDPGCILSGTSLTEGGAYTTGTFSSSSTSVTVASATGISNGMVVSGAGIPNNTTITISGTTVTLSNSTTAAGTNTALVFMQVSGTITAPSSGNKRIDRTVISTTTGALSIITGTPTAGTPSPPALTSGNFPVAQISLTSSTTAITNSIITDERNFWSPPFTASQITNSIGSNVSLNNTSTYFDGPSVAQGTTGTWFASGTVTLRDTSGAATFNVKLWDGTTLIASTEANSTGSNKAVSVSLSGSLASPAGNLRISAVDITSTSGTIDANDTSLGKDSTITAFRIA